MKINFKEFELVTDIAGKQVEKVDMREAIADVIYKQEGGIKNLDLAMKIYRSDENTEYDEEEFNQLETLIETHFKCMVIKSFLAAIDKGKEG